MNGTAMKVLVLSTALFSLPVLAQSTDPAGLPGCGDASSKFKVENFGGRQGVQPDAGKALVYFIEDDSNFGSYPKPTTRAGLDGKWVGATHGSSYLTFSVDPGVHHLCSSWQLGVILGKGHQTAAAHFTAEAGGVYYFEVKNTFILAESSAITDVTLKPLDSDEARLLVNKLPLSVSRRKD